MSETDDHGASYFRAFVDRLSKSAAADAGGERREGSSVRQLERPAQPAKTSPELDLHDAAVLALAARGGAAPIEELLAPPFGSIGQLVEVINDLQRFRLAELADGTVRLSEAGRSVALKLGA